MKLLIFLAIMVLSICNSIYGQTIGAPGGITIDPRYSQSLSTNHPFAGFILMSGGEFSYWTDNIGPLYINNVKKSQIISTNSPTPGNFLRTDGTNNTWGDEEDPVFTNTIKQSQTVSTNSPTPGNFLRTDGTNNTWGDEEDPVFTNWYNTVPNISPYIISYSPTVTLSIVNGLWQAYEPSGNTTIEIEDGSTNHVNRIWLELVAKNYTITFITTNVTYEVFTLNTNGTTSILYDSPWRESSWRAYELSTPY